MDEDFVRQLELEELEKKKSENSGETSDPYTYVDPNDGTVYEWDIEKKAWFPKVMNLFIFNY